MGESGIDEENERLRWAVNALRRRVKHRAECDLVKTWDQDKTLPCSCGLKDLIAKVREILGEKL